MNYIIKISLLLLLCLTCNGLKAEEFVVLSGDYKARNATAELTTFTVSQGDVVEFKITVNHKKRGLDIWVKQHPGNVFALDYDEFRGGVKKIVAPADAIYQVFYGGARLDFNIEIKKQTNKANGPGRGDVVHVCIPDTNYVSGYVDKEIGASYSLRPYKEKVVLGTTVQSETVCNRDFFTGVDLFELAIPADVKDEYREQKLLSYSVNLTCQSPEVYKEMMGVVNSGIDAFVKMPEFGASKKKKPKKMNHNKQYEFTDDLAKESEKWEKATELLELSQEAADTLAPNSTTGKVLETTAFLLDTDGMKQLALEEGLKAAGAPEEMLAIMNAVEEVPSASDLLKEGVNKYAPKVKGSAKLSVYETNWIDKPVYDIPQKEFWIQSAMNYGKNAGGCWDVPGGPTQTKKGQKLECWDIDNGPDRKFKIVASQKHPGYFEIHSALPGAHVNAVDNKGGNHNMNKNGNDILLWERHGDKCQLFRFEHAGAGKFKIINYDGFVVCLKGKKNGNGTNIHIWEDHQGAWTEWYLVDPITRSAFVPAQSANKAKACVHTRVYSQKGGAINMTMDIANPSDPLNLAKENYDLSFKVNKVNSEAKAKLIVEAKYRITDYTDVIKYERTEQPVNTRDFWTAYKIKYKYAIMFKDQVRDYYKIISESEYKRPDRPTEEVKKKGDSEQYSRLLRYEVLTDLNQN